MRERSLELNPPAADVTAAGRNSDLVALLNRIRRFRGDPAIDPHFAGHDCALRLVPAWEKSALDERLIETDAFGHRANPVVTS